MRALTAVALVAVTPVLLIAAAAPATRSALPAAPSAPLESFDAGALHIERYGNAGSVLILIPGLACGPWEFNGLTAHLAAQHQLYLVTLPGFDGRPAIDQRPLFDAFSADFWQLLATRHLDKPVVIGHSLGGTLAIALAEQYPERLSGIVAIDGLPVFPSLADATQAERTQAAAGVAGYAKLSKADQLAQEKSYMATIGTRRAELVDPAAAALIRSDPAAVAAWMQEDLAADLRPALKNITIPFVEIMPYNAADAQPPQAYTQDQTVAFYKAILAEAPTARVVPIPDSRHFVMLDQPDACEHALTDALAAMTRQP